MAPCRHIFLIGSLFLCGSLLWAQTKSSSGSAESSGAKSSSTPSRTQKTASAVSTAKKSVSAAKSSVSRTSAGKTSTSKSSSKAPARRSAARRTPRLAADQSHPTKDRYAEIQTALAKAGYYSGAKDGNWNDESVKALQQFQQDQNLEPTGKIDSLTLIRLNLGPHYDTDGTESGASAKPAGQAG